MSQIPHKIVLKSTTKISLNERFTSIQATRLQTVSAPVQQVRTQMAATQQATARNRRLAQQMANRPAVQAALKLKKRSLKQRLGTDVRSRLNFPGTGRGAPRGGRVMRARGGRGMMRGGSISGSQLSLNSTSTVGGGRGRGGFQPRGRGFTRGVRRPARGVARGMFRGGRGGGGRGRGTVVQSGPNGGRGGRGQARGQMANQIRGRGGRGMRRGGRVARGGQPRGRGMVRGRGGASSYTREQLDDQLEEYMSKTKGHLDSELDIYMTGDN